MVLVDTLCLSAKTAFLSCDARMAWISASLSFAVTILEPRACLPRAFLSLTLSAFVPNRRCLGLMHRRLSHECKTCFPLGIGPINAV